MFTDKYYEEIMNLDVSDFSRCNDKLALYNKRVRDLKENLTRVNDLIAYNKEELAKEQKKFDEWNAKKEKYELLADRAAEAGNDEDEDAALQVLSKMYNIDQFMDIGVQYCQSQIDLLEKAHDKLIKDAHILKSLENEIPKEYIGKPKQVPEYSEKKEEKREPKFSVFTNTIIK